MKNKPVLVERESVVNFYFEHKAEFTALYSTGEIASIEDQICHDELSIEDLVNLLKP